MMQADVQLYMDASHAMTRLAIMQTKLELAGLQAFMHTAVVPWLQKRMDSRFAGEGDEVTGRWSPLTRATQLIRASKGYPAAHPINRRTGQMRSFLTSADGNVTGGPGISSLTWPGNTGRARAIDQKIRTAQGLTPGTVARPVLGLGQTDNAAIMTELLVYLLS